MRSIGVRLAIVMALLAESGCISTMAVIKPKSGGTAIVGYGGAFAVDVVTPFFLADGYVAYLSSLTVLAVDSVVLYFIAGRN